MIGILGWFARNEVAANMLMWLIVFTGFFSLRSLPKEVFPEVSSDLITISVAYLGAAPAEVEEAICARIEERLEDLEQVKRVRSVASEGLGTVTVELSPGVDVREALDDVKSRVDSIDTFPAETEKPVIREVFLRSQVMTVVVSGAADELALRHLGERIRDDLAGLEGVSLVELVGSRPYEISIEVSEQALRRYRLTFDEIARAVRRSSLDLPGGSVKSTGGEILLRTDGQAYRGHEFENLVVATRSDGTRLTVGQVATVVDGFADSDRRIRYDGQPAVLVQVFRIGNQDVTAIAERVKDYVQEVRSDLPEGIELTIWKDETRQLESRVKTLLDNGIAGLILVLLVLTLFLRLKLALWVSAGIVTSFLGAFLLMSLFDVTINVHSVFAFIIVLGIVVDDAIVVGENILRHRESGKPGKVAAVEGVREVAVPVLFSVLTTIAAFVPLTMVSSSFGRVLRVIPLIVIFTLVFSCLESMLILPAHLSRLRAGKAGEETGWRWLQGRFSRFLDRVVERFYRPILARSLAWRYVTLAAGLAAFVLTIAVVAGGRVKFSFFPPVEADNLVAFLTMPQGTPPQRTEEALDRLVRGAEQLKRRLAEDGEPNAIGHVLASVGAQPSLILEHRIALEALGSTSHLGEVNVELAPSEARRLTASEINRLWRQSVGPIPDAVELTYEASLIATGAPIDIQLAGSSHDQLRRAAARLKEALGRYPGVFDVADSLRPGKQEVQLAITREAESMGLSLGDLGRQVRQAFYGEEAQRIQRGRDEVKVMVRYPERERRSLANLEQMRIRTPDGGEVPFSVAGRTTSGRGIFSIERTDGRRTVNVTADVDSKVANSSEILADLERSVLPEVVAGHRGMSYSFEGLQQAQRDTLGSILSGFALALFAIYALLAIPFRSYFQPFLIMSAIPFGIIGAVWGHVLMRHELSVSSVFGIVALTGVVVNDSLVMIDFINRSVRDGLPLTTAIRSAGERRFRPILLTSLTTFAGLTPLLLEDSVQAQFLTPLAISLGFGVLFATVISLILVPVSYFILEDLKSWASFLPGDRERSRSS